MKQRTPMKAIRAKCVECSGDNLAEVRMCEIDDCALWPYRMGRRPGTVRKGGSGIRIEKSATFPRQKNQESANVGEPRG